MIKIILVALYFIMMGVTFRLSKLAGADVEGAIIVLAVCWPLVFAGAPIFLLAWLGDWITVKIIKIVSKCKIKTSCKNETTSF